MALLMDSPSPTPGIAELRTASERKNLAKTSSWSCSLIPMPVSLTLQTTFLFFGTEGDHHFAAVGRVFDGVGDEVVQHL